MGDIILRKSDIRWNDDIVSCGQPIDVRSLCLVLASLPADDNEIYILSKVYPIIHENAHDERFEI